MKERNVGCDVLRLYSMFMIVSLHVLWVGGCLKETNSGSALYYILYSVQAALYCCVNCFGLISGFVLAGRDVKIKSILTLWRQVVFYSVCISLVFFFFHKCSITELIMSFFPFMTGSYWYFNSYVGLFFLIPILNRFIESASRRQYRALLFVLFVFGSLLPTFVRRDIFNTNSGYSISWLAILFLFGAYIRKYSVKIRTSPFVAFFSTVAVIIVYKCIVEYATVRLLGYPRFSNLLIAYNSPAELLLGIFLLIHFSEKKYVNGTVKAIIKKLSPMAFGVYIIHTHPVLFRTLIQDKFAFIIGENLLVTLLRYILVCSAIFSVSLFLEWTRVKSKTTLLKLTKRCRFIERYSVEYKRLMQSIDDLLKFRR